MSRPGLTTERLVALLQGELTRSESDETERLIADSRQAQERVAELREMMEELARPPEWAASVDLTAGVKAQLAAGERARLRHRSRWRPWMFGGGAALAAAAAVVLFVAGTEPPVPQGVRRKGAVATDGDPDRWVGVRLMLVRTGEDRQDPQPVVPGARLRSGELRVSYTNLGPQPYSHLMVFAVDSSGEVRWLYPAYERVGTDPAAIAIEQGASDAALPDLVSHEFAPGRLVLCGLFLRRPLGVLEVEVALAGRQPAPGHRLPFVASGQHCFELVAE